MDNLKQRYGKLLAVLLLLTGLLLVWALIIAPYQAMLADQARDVDRMQRKLHSLESLIENRDKFTAQYKSMQNNRSLDQIFLTRGKGVVAEARLQGIVRRLIERNGSVLTQSSLKKNNAKDEKGITLQVAMRGSVESAYKIFHAIENGWPAMVVKNVTVQALSNQHWRNHNGRSQYGRNQYTQNNKQHAMTASYEVTAYVK